MLKVIKHKDVDQTVIKEIICVKSIAWNYSYRSHLRWLNQNLSNEDLHFLVYENNELIAYANLVNVNILIDDQEMPLIGIGNVCTKYPGKGHGRLLFELLNKYLLTNSHQALLFCKADLVSFYEKLGWILCGNLHPDPTISSLTFNYKQVDGNCIYNDRLF